MKVANFSQTVAMAVTWSHISLVNVWTAGMRGMVAVCPITMTLTLITVWLAEQANRLFRAGHCYEGAGVGQILAM